MSSRRRPTTDLRRANRRHRHRQRILDVFRRYPGVRLYGPDIEAMSGVWGAFFYGDVDVLEQQGMITSAWEETEGEQPQRRVWWLAPIPPEQAPPHPTP